MAALDFKALWNQSSASIAYNNAIDSQPRDVMVFVHQDVYFPRFWCKWLSAGIDHIEQRDPNWGVIGIFGITADSAPVGRVWSSGLGRELGAPFDTPVPVVSIDEMVIVLRRASGLRFDPALPGFHLYGADLCLSAMQRGLGVYVVHAPAIHNSVRVRSLRGPYVEAYRHLKRKWAHRLPVPNLVAPIDWFEIGLWRAQWRRIRTRLLGRQAPSERADPRDIARRLGYE
jgi:hypothetical protein